MEIQIQVSEKEYLHYSFMQLRKWRGVSYHVILLSTAILIGCISIIFSQTMRYNFLGILDILRILGIILLSISFFFILVLGLTYLMLIREYKSNTLLKSPITYKFNDSGFSVTTPHSDAYIKWDMVVKTKQSPKTIAIYISNHQAYILPKSQLNTEQNTFIQKTLLSHQNAKSRK